MLVFIVAILTVFIIFIIIYIVTGQSKLNALVTTMALQRVRAVETLNTNKQTQNCNPELLKKNWLWDVLEIKWDDIHIILNDKAVHLPTTLIIPFIHKLTVRKLFGKKDQLHVYIMLKQRKSWYNLEVNGSKIHTENENLSVQL